MNPRSKNAGPVPILFTIPNFVTAGSGAALINVAERLDRTCYAPAICVLRRGGSLEDRARRAGIRVLETPFTVPARPYATLIPRARAAAGPLRPYGFALWHSFHYSDDYSEPLVARFAGTRAWIYTKKNMSWNHRSWHLRTLLATRVIAQNTDMMREFFGGPLFRRRVRLVPRGVDLDRFRPEPDARRQLIADLDIDPSALVIGCVAHLVPVKDHSTLIRAVAGVPSAHVLIAGQPLDKVYAEGLEHTARDAGVLDRVHFLGGVSDVRPLLAQLDVFVLPTARRGRQEGCPVALLEALASGKACIATDVSGSRDVIEHGRSGLLVPPGDAAALADALRTLAASPDLRASLGSAARARAVQLFDIDREAAAHQALYDEALGRTRSKAAAGEPVLS